MKKKTTLVKLHISYVFFFPRQHVHHHLLRESSSGIVSELSSEAMYEMFVSFCRQKLHVVVSYNAGNQSVAEMFRSHPLLIKNAAVHIAVKVSRVELRCMCKCLKSKLSSSLFSLVILLFFRIGLKMR